jgi:RHS repeat-associated protein
MPTLRVSRVLCLAIGTAAVCAVIPAAQGQTYRLLPLTHPVGTFTPASINNAYQVTGTVTMPDNSYHAVVRHVSGRFVELPEFAGDRSRAFGMNDLGHVGGWTLDGSGFGHAGVWRDGVFDEQSLPSGATTVPIALDLNNKSEAVGYYRGASSILHAFFWDAQGNVTKLPELTGGSSIAYAINESSEIAGAATLTGGTNHAVLWKKNAQSGNFEIQDLGSLGGPNSIAYDINNAGQVVGAAQNSPTTNHAFLWEAGAPMQDLGTLGGSNSGATAINDSGVIAARSEVSTLLGAPASGDHVSLASISRWLETTTDGPPPLSPLTAQSTPQPAGPLDRAAKLLKDNTGQYTWRNYNDRVPTGSPTLADAFAMNDSRATLVKDDANAYGLLLPFVDRNVISVCKASTGPCPEIDNFDFHPFSGFLTIAPGADGPTDPPLRLRFHSRPDFEHDHGEFGPGWSHEYTTHAAYFPSGHAEVCHPSGQVDLFRHDGTSWEHTSNCLQDQLAGLGGPGAGPVRNDAAPAAVQPEFVLYRAAENLFQFYTDEGMLAALRDPNGNSRTVTHAAGRLEEVTDDFGNQITFTYNASGLVSQVSDGTRTYQFAYTSGYLTSITDPMGRVTSFDYDETHPVPGLLKSITRPRGNTPHEFEYDDDGRLIRVTSAAGGIWTITYEGFDPDELPYPYRNRRTTITDPLGHTTAYVYDLDGNLVEVVDANGSSISYGYDNFGLRASITDRLGATSQIVHDPATLRPERVIEADGTSRRHTFGAWSAHGMSIPVLTVIQYPDGGAETYTYDGKANLLSFQDRTGSGWTYTYDPIGRMLTATNPVGGTTAYTYGSNGLLSSITDPDGNVTTLQYDGLDRLTRAQGADGTQMQWTYDPMDRILTSTDEGGGQQEFAYDQNGNLTDVTDALGNKSTFGYDALDRLVSFTDARGVVSSLSYDALNRPVQARDGNGNATSMAYDATGRPQAVTDAAGNSWQFSFDAEGIIASTVDPAGLVTSFTSDWLGRTTAITRAGATTTLGLDDLGRLTDVTGPDGHATTRQLDDRGRPTQITLPNGAVAQYTFDAAGQLTQAIDPAGGTWTQTRNAQGRLTSSGDPVGSALLYSHDNMNRPTQVSFPGGMGSMTVSYHPVGTVGGQTYSDGTVLTFTHDAEQHLTSTNGAAFSYDANGAMTGSNGIQITRDAGGRITSMTLAPGRTVSYQYDSRNLVTAVQDWTGDILRIGYDAVGRITGISRPNGVATSFTFDAEGRVTGIQEGALSSIQLGYDIMGRVSSAQRNTPVAADSLPQSSRALAFDAAARVSSYTYDAMGRQVSGGSRNFVWDLASRLTSYSAGGTTVTCTYDGLGNRLSRSEGGTTRTFVWNYALDLPSVSVVRSGGTDLRYYVHTPAGMLLYSIEAADGERRFYHFDEAGNTTALTNAQGNVIAAYAYAPYGAVLQSSGSADNPFTFGGLFGVYQEGSTGLYYMRARYYDSETGRFVSRDPVQSFSPEQLNPYQYALGNPLRHADPTGLLPFPLPPSPQAPAPLRPRNEFSSQEDFLRHYNDWSEQMKRWLKEVEERDRLIDEGGRPGSYEEWGWHAIIDTFGVKQWLPPPSRQEAWRDYVAAVNETNALVLRLELLARGHAVSKRAARGMYKAGITSVEEFEEHLARGRAASMAVHNQAVAASQTTALALLASRREAAEPCPWTIAPVYVRRSARGGVPGGTRLLTREASEIKDALEMFSWVFELGWTR